MASKETFFRRVISEFKKKVKINFEYCFRRKSTLLFDQAQAKDG